MLAAEGIEVQRIYAGPVRGKAATTKRNRSGVRR
jgi:hypothetical protein